MDKNMIKIDDLVRSRLGGAEEREPAGAWGAMKDLLDKEMPVQTAASFNWRRMLGYATGLVIATSVAVGGYRTLYSETSGDRAAVKESIASATGHKTTTKPSANHSTTSGSPLAADNASTAMDASSGTSSQRAYTDKHIAAKHTAAHKTRTTTKTATLNSGDTNPAASIASNNGTSAPGLVTAGKAQQALAGANRAHDNRHSVAKNSNRSQSSGAVNADKASGNPTSVKNNATAQALANMTAKSNGTANNGTIANGVSGDNNSNTGNDMALALNGTNKSTTTNNPSGSTKSITARNNANTGNIRNAEHNNSKPSPEAIIPSSAVNNPLNRNVAINDRPEMKRPDSIQQIEIKHRMVYNPETEKMIYRADTLVFRKVGVERESPVELAVNDATGQSAAKKQAFKPAVERNLAKENTTTGTLAKNEGAAATALPQSAAMTAAAVDDNNLVSLSKFRVSSKFNRLWDANAQRFSAFVQNVNIAIAKAQLYGGITGGFNTTVFSANTLAGFQLGLTGILAFNERWSIAADLKYNHRFNTASINDNYSKVSNIVPGAESQVNGVPFREYTWDQEGIIHYYNLTAVQNFELPVTLRYNVGRLFGEVGLNMFYSLPINVEEVERSQGNMMTVTRNFPANTSPSESIGGGKHVTLQDFNSRFGMGYVIGAGYEFTPALNANIRFVQNVWDNAVGSGAAKVSRNLYQTPSIQFSIGYRFSQGAGRR